RSTAEGALRDQARMAMIWGKQTAAGQFGVQGSATAAGTAATAAGIGVVATSDHGASLVLTDSSVGIPPLGGSLTTFWDTGAFVVNGGHLWYCIASGIGTASQWVKLSSTLITLPTPARVYDSRAGQPNQSPNVQGVLTFTSPPPSAANRVIKCSKDASSGTTVVPLSARTLLMN